MSLLRVFDVSKVAGDGPPDLRPRCPVGDGLVWDVLAKIKPQQSVEFAGVFQIWLRGPDLN